MALQRTWLVKKWTGMVWTCRVETLALGLAAAEGVAVVDVGVDVVAAAEPLLVAALAAEATPSCSSCRLSEVTDEVAFEGAAVVGSLTVTVQKNPRAAKVLVEVALRLRSEARLLVEMRVVEVRGRSRSGKRRGHALPWLCPLLARMCRR
jgi:hypothetical protein